MRLHDVLAPLNHTDFLETYLGRRYLRLRKGPRAFEALMCWDDLNGVLQSSRWSGQRMRLVQNGRQIDASLYLENADDGFGARLNARRLERLLASGATLVVNSVDESVAGVGEFAESCEELLRVQIGVNLYAGWRTDRGFDLHWDAHDTFILQISGRKKWVVYEPTLLHPLRGHPAAEPPAPTAPPAWEGLLEAGDVLYMPRGWWHVAFPLDEPTLHLTASWPHPTSIELLKWVCMGLRGQEDARASLPHLRSAEEQAAYVARLRGLLVNALTDDVVERFMETRDGELSARPRISLPSAVAQTTTMVESDVPLRLADGGRLHAKPSSDHRLITFRSGGHDWSCTAELAPALDLLRSTSPTTLRHMMACLQSEHRLDIQALVQSMLAKGAIWADRSFDTQLNTESIDTTPEPTASTQAQ